MPCVGSRFIINALKLHLTLIDVLALDLDDLHFEFRLRCNQISVEPLFGLTRRKFRLTALKQI